MSSIPIQRLHADDYREWLDDQPPHVQTWLAANDFSAKPGEYCILPEASGDIAGVVLGIEKDDPFAFWSFAALAQALPAGDYALPDLDFLMALAWNLEQYQFTRYKAPNDKALPNLELTSDIDAGLLQDMTDAISLVRDLINTPMESLGPAELASHAEQLAHEYKGTFHQVVGDALLEEHFPAIHVVGRASAHAPRLLELRWGKPSDPKVTLVGKGVCFDSGGLDLKPPRFMQLMKKDMGGAAHVLGLAQLIMANALPIQLRVLIPAVENAVSGNAYRPGDVIKTRKGMYVEVGDTDAEGRLILADALHYAAEEDPDLIIDFATLTGAARIALGTDVPVLFANCDKTAAALIESAEAVLDPIWRLPLYQPYAEQLTSPIADTSSTGKSSYAGAIVCALFLEKFVPKQIPWVHFDLMAWNSSRRPGRPEGGEAMGLRCVFQYLATQYA